MSNSKVLTDIKRLLLKSLGYDFDIVDQRISTLTAPGEHYGSVMLALDLIVMKTNEKKETESLSLVAKLLPKSELLRIAFDVEVTFKKEVLAYTEAMPAIVDFQKEFGVPQERCFDTLFPKCYGARVSLDENSNRVDEGAVLIFENLKTKGFYTEDRLKGFDFDAAKIVLEDLANFHASTIALKIIRPKVFDEKIRPCLVKNGGMERWSEKVQRAFNDSIMEGAREALLPESYQEKLQYVCNYAASHPPVDRPPPNEPWSALCHMDFWTSNTMLLRNDKGAPIKSKIVDLQLITYESCVRDLVFFLYTSVKNEVLEKHFDDFLKIYHERFLMILKDFDFDLAPFSWEFFQKELDEVAKTEIFHILMMLKPICTEKDKVQNSAENFQDSDWTRKDLLGPNHRRKLRDTVLALVQRGWL
ncbi:uncharacterized protein [Leptinotarsa decemlineata]|uniref:uncharacterized protein n=1 Tax=Leptinotarsa decemlineata TaxID=7539 RepID=UPI003D30CB1F